MDEQEALKIISLLAVNFLFSFAVSNYLYDEIDLINSPVASLKIFCSVYFMGYLILTITSAKSVANVAPRIQQMKAMFFVNSIFKWFIGVIIFHCLAVLYGASLERFVEETFMWSSMMSSMVILPCLLVGKDEIMKTIVSKRQSISLSSCLCCAAALTIMGAWVGAFTLPLDWDRDWQVWPIPCAACAMVGHSLSLLLSVILLCWKYRSKEKTKFI